MAEPVAVVFLNGGIWQARCPRPGCWNIEGCGRRDDGVAGGLTRDGSFRCRPEYGGCGLTCRAQWPASDVIEGVEQLVMCRPVPTSRNWEPGETLAFLLEENMARGLVPKVGQPVLITSGLDRPERVMPPELTPGHDEYRPELED